MTQIIQFVIRSVTKGVEEDPASSSVVYLPFATGHGPFEQMMPPPPPPPLQRISVAARGKGALGGKFCHCPCFEFVEMEEQGAKAIPFYNIATM